MLWSFLGILLLAAAKTQVRTASGRALTLLDGSFDRDSAERACKAHGLALAVIGPADLPLPNISNTVWFDGDASAANFDLAMVEGNVRDAIDDHVAPCLAIFSSPAGNSLAVPTDRCGARLPALCQ